MIAAAELTPPCSHDPADAIAKNPRRLGKPLMLEHEGRYSARRGPYRIVYEINDEQHLVRVGAIGHRRDIYRRR